MLKLELDWAGAEAPEASDDVSVELVVEHGPGGGHPVYALYARDGQALWAWLVAEYTGGDEDEASELASLADVA